MYNPSPVTLRQLVDFGQTATEEESFDFVKKEVPVRVANIMKEINLLPANLLQMPSVVVIQVGGGVLLSTYFRVTERLQKTAQILVFVAK